MNICIISKEFPPETGWGGVGSYCWNIAHGLADLGNSVDVICGSKKTETSRSIHRNLTVHRVKPSYQWIVSKFSTILHLGRGPYLSVDSLIWSFSAARFLKKIHLRKRIDIVECPEVNAQGVWVKKICNIPLSVKLHTPFEIHWVLNGNKLNFDCKSLSRLEQMVIKDADIVCSCSSALIQYLKSIWKRLPEISVIPNPVDHDLFSPKSLTIKEQKNVIGYFGRLERRKGISVLVRAFKKVVTEIPDAQLWLTGEDKLMPLGSQTWGENIRSVIRESDLTNRVRFLGHLDRNELPSIYNKSDVCVVPSMEFENFPYACLEAMACGKPVVASNCGGIPEIIENSVNGCLVPPNQPDALASNIVQLLSSEQMRKEIGTNARKTIEDRFTRQIIAKKTQRHYEQVLSR